MNMIIRINNNTLTLFKYLYKFLLANMLDYRLFFDL